MRTGSTPAKSRTILCMRAVPGMARGVRRRLLPQPSRLGRRRIVLTGPSLPSPLLLSGLQSCRRLVRRHQNRDRRPLWVIGLPCQTRGRSLRQADYPQLPRSTHPTTNLAATSSLLSCDDFIEYAHFQTVIDTGLDPGGDPAIRERETVEWRASNTLVGSRRQVRSSVPPCRLQQFTRRRPLVRRRTSSHEAEFRYGTSVAMAASPRAGRSTTATWLTRIASRRRPPRQAVLAATGVSRPALP